MFPWSAQSQNGKPFEGEQRILLLQLLGPLGLVSCDLKAKSGFQPGAGEPGRPLSASCKPWEMSVKAAFIVSWRPSLLFYCREGEIRWPGSTFQVHVSLQAKEQVGFPREAGRSPLLLVTY